jgi:hypothetical protein
MLSFLREQGGTQASSGKSNRAADTTSGHGAEPPREEKYLTVASHGGRTRRSTILLAVLFIAGLLCLWFMIKKSTPSAAVATTVDTEKAQIEEAMTRLIGVKSEMFSKMDEIVKKFYEFSDVLQIKVGELAKNPFTLDLFGAGAKKEPEVKPGPRMDAALLWRQGVERQAKDMQLLSIMQSDQGTCCMIGDQILRKGDSIQNFAIRQIGEDYVTLEWKPEQDDRPPGTESERIEIVLELPR